MSTHHNFSDDEFEKEFKEASLDPQLFTHEAHVRLAWIHIRKYGRTVAIDNIREQLKQYVLKVGAADKYNETLTVSAIKAVYHFELKSNSSNFSDFISKNPRLITGFKDLMFSHFQTDIFTSALAKRQIIEPELLPFDI